MMRQSLLVGIELLKPGKHVGVGHDRTMLAEGKHAPFVKVCVMCRSDEGCPVRAQASTNAILPKQLLKGSCLTRGK